MVRCSLFSVLSLAAALTPTVASAQPDPSGIDFVTIGAVGNRGYDGPDPNGLATGRGRVDYEYKIGRYEVTAGQWGEFFDAALNRADPIPYVRAPLEVGPGSMGAVGGITWRTAAIYCNWLHNNKSPDRAAFMSGAYDVSTFGFTPEGVFTDQAAHSPGARYWVPTLDEWMKAAHYDPDRVNDDGSVGGWWRYSITRDTAPVYQRPPSMGGLGEANAGFILTGEAQFSIPLGAYTTITSPWGLFDTAGGTSEWTETIFRVQGLDILSRVVEGSAWATPNLPADSAWSYGDASPTERDYMFGFRIAPAVPSSPSVLVVALGVCSFLRRRRGKGSPCDRPQRSSLS